MKTPDQILEHADKYKDKSWEQYTPEQLASWAINFTIRATHRTESEKCEKDIQDGKNYLAMLTSWMDHMNERARHAQKK